MDQPLQFKDPQGYTSGSMIHQDSQNSKELFYSQSQFIIAGHRLKSVKGRGTQGRAPETPSFQWSCADSVYFSQQECVTTWSCITREAHLRLGVQHFYPESEMYVKVIIYMTLLVSNYSICQADTIWSKVSTTLLATLLAQALWGGQSPLSQQRHSYQTGYSKDLQVSLTRHWARAKPQAAEFPILWSVELFLLKTTLLTPTGFLQFISILTLNSQLQTSQAFDSVPQDCHDFRCQFQVSGPYITHTSV